MSSSGIRTWVEPAIGCMVTTLIGKIALVAAIAHGQIVGDKQKENEENQPAAFRRGGAECMRCGLLRLGEQ